MRAACVRGLLRHAARRWHCRPCRAGGSSRWPVRSRPPTRPDGWRGRRGLRWRRSRWPWSVWDRPVRFGRRVGCSCRGVKREVRPGVLEVGLLPKAGRDLPGDLGRRQVGAAGPDRGLVPGGAAAHDQPQTYLAGLSGRIARRRPGEPRRPARSAARRARRPGRRCQGRRTRRLGVDLGCSGPAVLVIVDMSNPATSSSLGRAATRPNATRTLRWTRRPARRWPAGQTTSRPDRRSGPPSARSAWSGPSGRSAPVPAQPRRRR